MGLRCKGIGTYDVHPSFSSLCRITLRAGHVVPVTLPILAEWLEWKRCNKHRRPRQVVKGPKGSKLSVNFVSAHSDAHDLFRAAPEYAHTESLSAFSNQGRGQNRPIRTSTGTKLLRSTVGLLPWDVPLGSKVNGPVRRTHLALGRARTDIRALASLTSRHTSTVHGSRTPLAQYNLQCKAHRRTKLVHTACWTQELGTNRFLQREALCSSVRPSGPTLAPFLAPQSQTQEEAGCFFLRAPMMLHMLPHSIGGHPVVYQDCKKFSFPTHSAS